MTDQIEALIAEYEGRAADPSAYRQVAAAYRVVVSDLRKILTGEPSVASARLALNDVNRPPPIKSPLPHYTGGDEG